MEVETLTKKKVEKYKPVNNIRIITGTSLFDGHDAAINIMRRIMQDTGAEVIHLGHDRSVPEFVKAAIEEDVQTVAVTSYQGGHMEFFKYLRDCLVNEGYSHIRIVGGGGGVILPSEIEELHKYGIARIYHPDDGMRMGLQGMINDVLMKSDFPRGDVLPPNILQRIKQFDRKALGVICSAIDNFQQKHKLLLKNIQNSSHTIKSRVVGVTGSGGSGKSTIIDELIRLLSIDYPNIKIGVISIDPSRAKSPGALLGDRLRYNSIYKDNVFFRSVAGRGTNSGLPDYIPIFVDVFKYAGCDFIFIETPGIGQSDIAITQIAPFTIYVMTPEYGAQTQLEKIRMLEVANMVVVNKGDKMGAQDAYKQVLKQYKRNHEMWEVPDENVPVFLTVASKYNNPSVKKIYEEFLKKTNEFFKDGNEYIPGKTRELISAKSSVYIVPPSRVRYLSEISETIRKDKELIKREADLAREWQNLQSSIKILETSNNDEKIQSTIQILKDRINQIKSKLRKETIEVIENWEKEKEKYQQEYFEYQVRDKVIRVKSYYETLSGTKVPKVIYPNIEDWGERVKWYWNVNVPGKFPYTCGVFPFKREDEEPTRMFAGEGSPERTNRRFHYICKNLKGKRLSTAFDSPTLYGMDPSERPDIYGKIGNSGVSICCLDDMKKLYSGFNLIDPLTSVSMTINGPAPTMNAYFFNAVIDQACELYIKKEGLEEEVRNKIETFYRERGVEPPKYNGELPSTHNGLGLLLLGLPGSYVLPIEIYNNIKKEALACVRGTVQADILKEDQAQNTCIFSIEFALRCMADMQEYYIKNNISNFYSVSISGYHIGEAGANPITQLAFTIANGFTYLEYYLSRGMPIEKFSQNFSFFFSNGLDIEYSVFGRVARRIWAKALKFKYGASERAQKLKYHLQTSGRSLHAQEMEFNDIRTTLEALYAVADFANSIHTNAYDEAISTPTEESVRRALAIQQILTYEYGLTQNQNPFAGSYLIEWLTDYVEEKVLEEFDRLTERGGVLGAMEFAYQRNKIQEESLYYEKKKNTGEYIVIGVNKFLNENGATTVIPQKIVRSTDQEKKQQLETVKRVKAVFEPERKEYIEKLKKVAASDNNVFEILMEAAKFCTIGDITEAFFEVGGRYRRNM